MGAPKRIVDFTPDTTISDTDKFPVDSTVDGTRCVMAPAVRTYMQTGIPAGAGVAGLQLLPLKTFTGASVDLFRVAMPMGAYFVGIVYVTVEVIQAGALKQVSGALQHVQVLSSTPDGFHTTTFTNINRVATVEGGSLVVSVGATNVEDPVTGTCTFKVTLTGALGSATQKIAGYLFVPGNYAVTIL